MTKGAMLLSMAMIMACLSAPLWSASLVTENFDSGAGGFEKEIDQFFSVSKRQFLFQGDQTDRVWAAFWRGGANPGDWYPEPSHSNYFKDFNVSVDVDWKEGSEYGGHGLAVCNQKHQSGGDDYVRFHIDQSSYTIQTEKETLVDWTFSSHLVPRSINELSIFKRDNGFWFSINGTVVEQLTIEGCAGGAIGVEASMFVDVAFDNFSISPLIIEDFNRGVGGFRGYDSVSVSDGQLLIPSDGTEGAGSFVWAGGLNSANEHPNPSNSNYFDNVIVSVDAIWKGGHEDAPYGLSVCNQANSTDAEDYVAFLIDGQGDNIGYTVETVQYGQYETPVNWTISSTIKPGEPNNLSIFKVGNQLVFSINGTKVEQLTVNGCKGGSINLDASNSVGVAFDNFVAMGLPSSGKMPITPLMPATLIASTSLTANFTVASASGKAPLTVNLDASAATDPGGTITSYRWTSSDSQTASGKTATMTFEQPGNYTIKLVVTNDNRLTRESSQKVTVEAGESQPTRNLHLAFQGLKESYDIGDVVSVDLVQKVQTNRFKRVNLWVAIQVPGALFFKTDRGINPFTPQLQALKTSLDTVDTTEKILAEFELSPGMGGEYIFYAAYVKEGEDPLKTDSAVELIISQKTTLANE